MSNSIGKRKLIRDISANTLQTGVTQVFGLVIFYLTSRYLSKDAFGELSWSTALGSTAIAILSLGLDLVFVKKVAQGDDVITYSGIHYFHTVISGAVFTIIALVLQITIGDIREHHPLLLLVFFNLAVANIANSFKLCLNGLEAYRQLARLALIINLVKVASVVVLLLAGIFELRSLIFAYLFCSMLEYILAYFVIKRIVKKPILPLLRPLQYKYFILESLPQLGVVLFDSALARLDWILLGIIGTAAATAEYSFAYKVFELSKLPLLVIAPILLTRLSRNLSNGKLNDRQQGEFEFFFRVEVFIVMLIPIFLTSSWSGLIDFFTEGKYGAVNYINYLLLAVCVPLSAFINFYWTIGFVEGKLKAIMYITLVSSLLNVVLNAFLIKLYGTLGASISFLVSTVLQLIMYRVIVGQTIIQVRFKTVFFGLFFAVLSVVLVGFLGINAIFSGVVAVAIYVGLSIGSKLIKPSEFSILRSVKSDNSAETNSQE